MVEEFGNIYQEPTHPTMTPIEAPRIEATIGATMLPVREETPETMLVQSEGTVPTESREPTLILTIEERPLQPLEPQTPTDWMTPQPMHRFPREELIYVESTPMTLTIEDHPTPSSPLSLDDHNDASDPVVPPIKHVVTPEPERTLTPIPIRISTPPTPVYVIPQN